MNNKLSKTITTYNWNKYDLSSYQVDYEKSLSGSQSLTVQYSDNYNGSTLVNPSTFIFTTSTTTAQAQAILNKFVSITGKSGIYYTTRVTTYTYPSYLIGMSLNNLTSITTASSSSSSAYPNPYGKSGNYYYIYTGSSESEGTVIDDSAFIGGIKYEHVINAEDNVEVGDVASAQISFTTTSSAFVKGDIYSYSIKQRNDNNYWRQIGKFIINSVEKKDNRYTVKAYDTVSKFDKVIDSWIANTAFPTTETTRSMQWLLSNLCTECGATLDPAMSSFTNSTYECKKQFTATNFKGRTLLQYIAQVAGGFIVADASGQITIKHFSNTPTATLTSNQYITRVIGNNTSPAIQQVKIAASTDSEGVVKPDSPAGTSTLFISGNPLLAIITGEGGNIDAIRTVAQNIYDIVKNYSYTPVQVELYEDYGLKAGDTISINNKTSYIFTKSMQASGVSLESTTAVDRSVYQSSNQEIVNLKGEYNILKNEVNVHEQRLGNAEGDISTVTQTANAINAQVSDGQGNYTVLNMRSGDVVIGNQSGSVSIKGSQINADTLNLTGHIKFSDFNQSDPTTLDWLQHQGQIYRQNTKPTSGLVVGALWLNTGANITEGSTIYYANSWYSWDGSVWSMTSNPYYIKSTYIDATTIQSPTIVGNDIKVNADAGGGFKVQLNGTTKGFMGAGTYTGGGDGVIVCNDVNGDNIINPTDDYYLAINSSDARLQADENYIKIDANGCWVYNKSEGTLVKLTGYAVFA